MRASVVSDALMVMNMVTLTISRLLENKCMDTIAKAYYYYFAKHGLNWVRHRMGCCELHCCWDGWIWRSLNSVVAASVSYRLDARAHTQFADSSSQQ